jgi:hypothetical protein
MLHAAVPIRTRATTLSVDEHGVRDIRRCVSGRICMLLSLRIDLKPVIHTPKDGLEGSWSVSEFAPELITEPDPVTENGGEEDG